MLARKSVASLADLPTPNGYRHHPFTAPIAFVERPHVFSSCEIPQKIRPVLFLLFAQRMGREHRDTVLQGNLSKGCFCSDSLFPQLCDFLGSQHTERRTAQSFALATCVLQSSFYSLNDQRTLPLGNRTDDLEQHLAIGSDVSIASVHDTKPMLRVLNSSRALSSCVSDRANLSNFQTTTMSIFFWRQSAKSASGARRRSTAPDTPLSV